MLTTWTGTKKNCFRDVQIETKAKEHHLKS